MIFLQAKKHRHHVTIILALAGIALMFYYNYCGTSCRYLQGDIWEIDLKLVGSAYMIVLIFFAAIRQASLVRFLLAAGLGVEVYLFSFQVQNDVYCPFCLAFALMIITVFIIDYEIPTTTWRENRRRMWLYFLGEIRLPMFKLQNLPLLLISLLGYFVIAFTFSGSVTPAYGGEVFRVIPTLGKGNYEVILFTDYFCPPCRAIDTKAEPLFEEFLASRQVRIKFVDVPMSKVTPIYAKYYLYAVNAGNTVKQVLKIRAKLFSAAQERKILKEDELLLYLSEQNIIWKPYDEKPVLQQFSQVIRENAVNKTPICVVKYSATDIKKYIGRDEIWDGLTKLKKHLRASKR